MNLEKTHKLKVTDRNTPKIRLEIYQKYRNKLRENLSKYSSEFVKNIEMKFVRNIKKNRDNRSPLFKTGQNLSKNVLKMCQKYKNKICQKMCQKYKNKIRQKYRNKIYSKNSSNI